MTDGVASQAAISNLGTLGKVALVAKPLVLGALGKYAIYKWLTKGTNAGIQSTVKVGPLSGTITKGFEIVQDEPDSELGDFWYEPLPEGQVVVEEDLFGQELPQVGEEVVIPSDDTSSTFFGLNGGLALGPVEINGGFGLGR